MLSDLRHAFRVLLTAPAFTALVLVVLGLGIGANTAIFSIVHGVLLKPLPFADATRLVAIRGVERGDERTGGSVAHPDFMDWRAQARAIDRFGAYAAGAATLTGRGEAEGIETAFVTPELMTLLGVRPIAGRLFTDADDAKNAAGVAVISENLWRRRFGADASLVGQALTLDSKSFTVIGVMPAAFEFPYQTDRVELWVPMGSLPFTADLKEQRGASYMKAIGRLRDGATVEQAQAELSAIARRLGERYPKTNAKRDVRVEPLHDTLVSGYRRGLLVLLSAVGAVLLIACANVASLLLARGASRRNELAIRAALGASRGRIARQLLVESVVLSSGAGVAGLLVAMWGVSALIAASPIEVPRLHAVHIDRAVLAFTTAVSMLTGILFGVAPALSLARSTEGAALKEGSRGSSGGGAARTRQALVVAEVALSLVLLVAAGLLARSFVRLQRVEPGFVPQRAVGMQLLLPGTRYPDAAAQVAFYDRLLDLSASIAGADAVGVSTTLPMTGSHLGVGFTVEGRPPRNPAERPVATAFAVSPDYFKAMGIPVRRGRGFTRHDHENAPTVMVVSETFARRYFPAEDPLGKRIAIGYINRSAEIVGVAGDVKQANLAERPAPQMYTPYPQTPWPFLAIAVRTAADPRAIAGALRHVVRTLDPDQPAGEVRTIDEYLAESVATPRFYVLLVVTFAALAVLLAGCGLYGLMSYSVAQRRREIGIRMALGAQPADLRSLVVSQALRTGAVGLGIGLAAALAVSRLLESLLFEVDPADPATFGAVCVVLLAVVVTAAYWPARRATRVDPIVALRAD